ncbi:hypothetical protein SAMN06298216_0967 [Spirosomataceae bacterium TFI 002]|nr:hypothetical protein SAMN06298216_0967 [Spirosomataceae bacterium TFI 002]
MKKVILSIGFMLTAFVGFSQQVTHTVTIDLANVLEVTEGTTASQTLAFDAIADYEDGVVSESASTFTFSSNLDWTVNVKAASALFAYTGDASGATTEMPASVLEVSPDGTAFIALSTTDQTFETGTAGADKIVGATYKADPGYAYAEGSYEIDVQYTITQE